MAILNQDAARGGLGLSFQLAGTNRVLNAEWATGAVNQGTDAEQEMKQLSARVMS